MMNAPDNEDDLGPVVSDEDSLGPVVSEEDSLGPVVAHAPSVGERVVGAAKGVGRFAGAVATGLSDAVASPITAVQAKLQGHGLEKTLNALPEPDIDAMRAKGYSEEQIHNVLKGHAETQASLAQDVEEMGKQGVRSTAEGLATYGTLPLGGPIKQSVEAAAAKTLTTGALKSVLGKAAVGAAEGGLFGAGYGAVKGTLAGGAEAAERGEGAGQVFSHMLWGAGKDAVINAAAGVALGGVLTGVFAGGAKVLGAKQAAIEAAQQAATKAAAVDAFDKSFHPSLIGERFSMDLAEAAKNNTPDAQLAAQIVSKLMNVTPETADPGIVAIMEKKIAQFRAQAKASVIGTGAELYPEVNLPPVSEGVPPAGQRIPLSPDLEPTGGTPPGAIGIPTLPSPIERVPGTLTPAPFAPPEGFEPGLGEPAASTPGMSLEGIAPPESPNPPMPLRTPLGAEPRPLGGIPAQTPAAPAPTAAPNLRTSMIESELPPRQMPAPTGPAVAKITPEVPFTEVQPAAPPVQGATAATKAVPKPPLRLPGEAPSASPKEASFHMNALGTPTGVPGWQAIGDVSYRTSVDEKGGVELNYLENLGKEKGAGAAVLKKLTKVADEHQVPMSLNALPLPRGNGKGRIPLDKLIEFYRNHGFEIVEQGDGWAEMRREPVPQTKADPEMIRGLKEVGPDVAARIEGLSTDRAHMAAGNVTEGKPLVPEKASMFTRLDAHLGAIEDAAKKRLSIRRIEKAMNPEVHAGVNPDVENLRDLSILAAAKMFRLGIRSTKKVGEALMAAHGEWIKPLLDKAITRGRAMLMKMIANDRPTVRQLDTIRQMYQTGKIGKDWYENTWSWLQKHFGEDAEMVARFISATSLGNSTEGNATQMLKAYGQWKLGLPFEGHLNKVHTMSLGRAVRGELFGDGKAQGFLGALTGDPNAVALDRQVMRALGFKNAGMATGKSALSNSTYKLYSTIIRDLAQEQGVTPRQYQAALWVAPKLEGIQMEHAAGINQHRTGSFRPMEELIEPRLKGLTPSEWVEQNKVNLQSIRNASEGVTKARTNGGYSFNPSNFSEHQSPGYIVTLDHKVVPIGEASGTAVIRNTRRYQELIDKYHGAFTGLYLPGEMGADKMMHMDFNIQLPDHPGNEEFAKRLGLEGRQFSVGHIDAEGKYRDIATGYDPAVHGPQFPQRRVAEIDAQLQALKVPTKDDPANYAKFLPAKVGENGRLQFDPEVHQFAIDNPALALARYGEVSGKSPAELKELINSGQFKPMTDAGVAGAVVVNKDGIVWQYQDPTAPSYNTMTPIGSLRGKNMPAMLDKLKGLDILRGHDVIENYRSQAGFASLRGKLPEGEALQRKQAEVFKQMVQAGGSLVPPTELTRGTGPFMRSYWITPNGRVVRSTMTHVGHARVMGISGVRGYEGTDGSAGATVQTLLNMGFIRVQASGNQIALDSSAPITAAQRSLIKQAATGRDFWAQITDPKGKLISYFSTESDKIHHYLAAASEGNK